MERRKFLSRSVAGGMALGLAGPVAAKTDLPSKFTPTAYARPTSNYSPFTTPDYYTFTDDLVIERNRPAMVTHPTWSLQCDVRMFRLFVTGQLGPELKRAGVA